MQWLKNRSRSLLDNILYDGLKWVVGLMIAGLILFLGPSIAFAKKLYYQEPIPLAAFIGVTALGALLSAIAIILLIRVRSRSIPEAQTTEPTNRFNIDVGPNFTSDNLWSIGPVRFLHAELRIQSGTVHGCRAYLTAIKGEMKEWTGNEQLTFSPSEATDSLSKAIYTNVPYLLDVLVITSAGDVLVCNQNRQWPRLPRLRDLFAARGFYDITIVVAGEDAAAEQFQFRFERTGNWQTCLLHPWEQKPSYPTNVSDSLEVTFDNSDCLIVRVINHDPDRDAKIKSVAVFGINIYGEEKQILSTKVPNNPNVIPGGWRLGPISLPYLLAPRDAQNFETLILECNLGVNAHAGYFGEVTLQTGETVRSEVTTVSPRENTPPPKTEEGKAMFYRCLKQIREGVPPLKALQNVNAETLDTTADLLRFYDDLLMHNVADFADAFPVPKENWLPFLQFAVGHDLGTPSGMDDAMRDLLEVSHRIRQGALPKNPRERMEKASEIGRVLETIFASPTYALPDNQPAEWINEVRTLIVQHAPAFVDQFNLAVVSPYSGALYPRKEFTATDIAEWSKDPRRTQGWHIISAVLQKLHEIKRTL